MDFISVKIHHNHQMPFTFDISEEGPYTEAQLANVKNALQYAGSIVQNTYRFERDISVDVQFEDMDNDGGGARGTALQVVSLNNAIYPTSLAKLNCSEEDWQKWVEEKPERSVPDIEITFDTMTDWYTGTDGNVSDGQYDFVSYAVHELHHGIGWLTVVMDKEGGEDGEPERLVRKPVDPLLCFEKYLCFLTATGHYCPIAPYLLVNDAGTDDGEKTRREVMLARILQSNNVYFSAGENNNIRLYAPTVYEEGSSICHIDYDVDPNGVMEPCDTDIQVKHEIGTREQQIVTYLMDSDHAAPPECSGDDLPEMAPDRRPIYRHARHMTGSVSDVSIPKANKRITKKTNTKGQSKAIKNVQQTFKKILRLDVQFKARMQMVSFNTKNMKMFTAHQKQSGIVVHHRQDIEVDGVSLPIAVARQIRGPKTIRQRAAHPKYQYDIDIFVDKNVKWDYKTTAQSASGSMGFQSTLLRQLCEAFRFTNSSEYVQTKTDEKGNPTFKLIGRKLFLSRDFGKDWMRPTRAHPDTHLISSPVSLVD